jgi:hypothetical protein
VELLSTPAPNIFDTLAQHETDLAQHNAAPVTQAAQPNIFDTLAANEGNLQRHDKPPQGPTLSSNANTNAGAEAGLTATGMSQPVARMTAPLARKLMDAYDKLKEVESFTPEGKAAHPIQAKLGEIADSIEGFLFGGSVSHDIGTKGNGILTNPVTAALIPGAEGEPAAAALLRGGAGVAREGMQVIRGGKAAGEVAEEAPGIVKQVLKGKEVAQEPAKAAIRGAAGAEDEAALLEGHKTVLDEPLKNISTKERAAYAKQDEAAGFDVKETRKKLSDAEYKVKQPEIDDATRTRLEKTITESKQSLAEAEKKMQAAGVNPHEADSIFKQRRAGEEFKKALVQHVSPDGESVNVDGLLNASKKLRFSKYGDRLEQFMGKENAEKYMEQLQNAQKLGVHAVKMRWIAGVLGIGGGEEIIRHSVNAVAKAVSK